MRLFTWSDKDPSNRKIQEGGTTYVGFTCKNLVPYGAKVEKVREGIKNGGRQKQNCNLGPYTFFTGVNNYLSAELLQ